MSPLDVIEIPGHPGKYARRVTVEAWQRAGSPPINDAARLKATQKWLWQSWVDGVPGFNPADNPDDPTKPCVHVRGVGLDVPPIYADDMLAAGFEQPYDYELWHFQLPNVWAYPLIESFPTADPTTESEEDDTIMKNCAAFWYNDQNTITVLVYNPVSKWFHYWITGTSANDGAYNETQRVAMNCGDKIGLITISHADVLLKSLNAPSVVKIVADTPVTDTNVAAR